MRTVSERWQQNVGGVNRWVSEIDWSNNGGADWERADLVAGTITADSTSQIRWSCDLDIRGPAGREAINGFTTRVRVRHGIEYAPGDRELLGMGIYRIDSVDTNDNDPELLKIAGGSFEKKLLSGRFLGPRVLPSNDAAARLETLITEIIPDAVIYWDGIQSIWLPKMTVERDRWPTIDGNSSSPSIAKSLGGRVFCNGDGVFIVAPPSSLEDRAVWTAAAGEGGVLIGSSEQLTAEGVSNMIVASGETTEGTKPVFGVARDVNPYSPTYWLGQFGQRPRFYTSQMIQTERQAIAVAKSMLAPYLGLQQQVSFDSLHDPRKEPGDVGIVSGATGDRKVILDSVTYDLLGGPLQANTRTTATRYAGSFDALGNDEGGDSE